MTDKSTLRARIPIRPYGEPKSTLKKPALLLIRHKGHDVITRTGPFLSAFKQIRKQTYSYTTSILATPPDAAHERRSRWQLTCSPATSRIVKHALNTPHHGGESPMGLDRLIRSVQKSTSTTDSYINQLVGIHASIETQWIYLHAPTGKPNIHWKSAMLNRLTYQPLKNSQKAKQKRRGTQNLPITHGHATKSHIVSLRQLMWKPCSPFSNHTMNHRTHLKRKMNRHIFKVVTPKSPPSPEKQCTATITLLLLAQPLC